MDKKKFIKEVPNPIKEKYTKPCISMDLIEEDSGITSSKVGGTPYIPKDFEQQRVRTGENAGKYLRYLAQINFAEVPRLEDFPEKGILQIYYYHDDEAGLDSNTPNSGNKFRLIYHENIEELENTRELEINEGEKKRIFFGQLNLRMEFKEAKSILNSEIWEFEEIFLKQYNKVSDNKIQKISELPNEYVDIILDEMEEYHKHQIGGYPMFLQLDPRNYEKDGKEYDTLLFQLSSERFKKCCIEYGDGGIAQYLMKREDLIKKDFSNVMYTWDCD